MIKVLVDTSSWINFFTGRNRYQAVIIADLLRKGRIVLNGLILGELLQGVRKDEERKILESRLVSLPFLPLERDDFIQAGHVSARLRQRGETINLVDILIAQTAMSHHVSLLHYDNDFNRIARLTSLRIHKSSLK